jgi:hypothetical protein
MDQETDVLDTMARFNCLQGTLKDKEESDIRYRNAIGAPSSKSLMEEYYKNESKISSKDKQITSKP